MAYNYFMQPTLPPDTGESPSLGASRIRNLKNALIERLNSWIYGFDTNGSESEIGVKSVPLRNQASAPSTPTAGMELYSKDSDSTAELFAKDESGNEVQITKGGTLANVGSAYVDKDINTEYLAETALFLYAEVPAISATLKVATDINFSSLILNFTNSYGETVFHVVVPKGCYYKIQSASSGKYKVIKI